MKFIFMIFLVFMLRMEVSLATSRVCEDQKYISKIGTYNLTGYVTRQWFIEVNDSVGRGDAAKAGNDDRKIRINQERAPINSERGRALYVLAANAMNNNYKVRLVDNFGANCASIDEIDIFRSP